MRKYAGLTTRLEKESLSEIILGFGEIEEGIGRRLPKSATPSFDALGDLRIVNRADIATLFAASFVRDVEIPVPLTSHSCRDGAGGKSAVHAASDAREIEVSGIATRWKQAAGRWPLVAAATDRR